MASKPIDDTIQQGRLGDRRSSHTVYSIDIILEQKAPFFLNEQIDNLFLFFFCFHLFHQSVGVSAAGITASISQREAASCVGLTHAPSKTNP